MFTKQKRRVSNALVAPLVVLVVANAQAVNIAIETNKTIPTPA